MSLRKLQLLGLDVVRVTRFTVRERLGVRVTTFTTQMRENVGRPGVHFRISRSWESEAWDGVFLTGGGERLEVEEFEGRCTRSARSLRLAVAKHEAMLTAFRRRTARIGWTITSEEEAPGHFDLAAGVRYLAEYRFLWKTGSEALIFP